MPRVVKYWREAVSIFRYVVVSAVLAITLRDSDAKPAFDKRGLFQSKYVVARFDQIGNLESLGLTPRSVLDSEFFELLAHLQPPRILSVSEIELGDREFRWIASLKSLEVLRLNNCHITDSEVNWLTALEFLRFLELKDNQISDRGLASFSAAASLENLDLEGNPVSEVAMSALEAKLPRLKIKRRWLVRLSEVSGQLRIENFRTFTFIFLEQRVPKSFTSHLSVPVSGEWKKRLGKQVLPDVEMWKGHRGANGGFFVADHDATFEFSGDGRQFIIDGLRYDLQNGHLAIGVNSAGTQQLLDSYLEWNDERAEGAWFFNRGPHQSWWNRVAFGGELLLVNRTTGVYKAELVPEYLPDSVETLPWHYAVVHTIDVNNGYRIYFFEEVALSGVQTIGSRRPGPHHIAVHPNNAKIQWTGRSVTIAFPGLPNAHRVWPLPITSRGSRCQRIVRQDV